MTLFVLGGKEVKRASGLIKHYSLEIKSNVFISTIDSKIRGLLMERLKKFGQSALVVYDYPNEQGFKVMNIGNYNLLQSDELIIGVEYGEKYFSQSKG